MKIFVDMDGVIVNYLAPFLKEFNLQYPYGYTHTENVDKSLEDIYPDIDKDKKYNLPTTFWENMGWIYDGKEILTICENLVGQRNVFILSSPGKMINAPTGKMVWIKEHIPEYYEKTILTKSKFACAQEDAVLIDDTGYVCGEFRGAGGKTILCPRRPRPWNRHRDYVTTSYIKGRLEEFIDA